MTDEQVGVRACQIKRRYWAITSIPKMWEPFTPCRANCLATPERPLRLCHTIGGRCRWPRPIIPIRSGGWPIMAGMPHAR